MEKGHEIQVLDHGYVRLVDYMGSDEAIIEAARMSTGRSFTGWDTNKECTRCGLRFPKTQTVIGYKCMDGPNAWPADGDLHDWKDIPGDSKLLAFLYANKHMTPFECGGEMMIEVQAPIMVFREWHRHRTQSYNEFSARYAQMPNLHYLPELSRFQKQSTTNKQGSAEAIDEEIANDVRRTLAMEQQDTYIMYSRLVDYGLAKEVARLNTPVSRYSKMRAKTDLRNWLAFLTLRMAPNAQWEIRQYANAVAEIVKSIWPRTYALFEEHDLHGVHLSRSEAAIARRLMSTDGIANAVLQEERDSVFKKLGGAR